MLSRVAAVLVLSVLLAVPLAAAEPGTYFLDAKHLASEKQRLAAATESDETLRAIRQFADSAMRVGPYSVMDKEQLPPSGDKHDFLSMSPYWWPDPKSPNGLPFIRRDGERNPEASKIPDRDTLAMTAHAAYTLSLAYYLTGRDEYGARAALLLRTWFLDPKTRMNPNMNHGQYIRGRDEGRGAGLIESRHFVSVIETLALLEGSKHWSAADQQGMKKWFGEYFEWLRTSKNGRQEVKAGNNHGNWFEAQYLAIAIYLDRKQDVAESVQRARKRIAAQIEPDGRQPRELQRTKAMQYSTFNLLALTHVARLVEKADADLWSFSTSDGRSIRKALDWLIPFVLGKSKFEYQQIKPYDPDELVPVLHWAKVKYKDAKYAEAAKQLAPGASTIDILLLAKMNSREIPGE